MRATISIDEEVGVSVIGNNQQLVTQRQSDLYDLPEAFINGLSSYFSSRKNASMPDHVGIGKVETDKVGGIRLHVFNNGTRISGLRS